MAELAPSPQSLGDVAFDLYDTHGFPLEVTKEIADERDIDIDLEGYEAALKNAQHISARKTSKKGDVYANLTSFQEVLDRVRPDRVRRARGVRDEGHGARGRRRQRLPRPHAVLRGVRRPGRRHRHDHHRHRSRRGARHHLRAARSAPPPRARRRGRDRAGRGGDGGHRRRAARRDPAQPHGHPHPPLGAAGGARRPREAAGVARGARPPALRLQPLRSAVTPEQIREIEDLANEEILANDPVRHYETTKATAEQLGAIAFFGDKYGDVVRGARSRAALDSSSAAAPTCAPSATSAR